MPIDAFLTWLASSDFATAIREGDLLFPWIEALHVLAVVMVVGSIAMVDLRLLGWASSDRAFGAVAAEMLPVAVIALVFAVITGLLMFCARALDYGHNVFFQLKMAMLLLAGANMVFFQKVTSRQAATWGAPDATPPLAARVAGGLSLLFWVCIVACGRWTGFVTANTP